MACISCRKVTARRIARSVFPAGGAGGAGGDKMTMMSDYSRTIPLDWDGHIMLVHGSESERTFDLAAWVRRGLENDEKVIYTECQYEQLSTTGDHLQDAAFSHVGGGIRQRALHTRHLADQLVLVGEI